jgi:SAM-dependent methyltransferase
LHPSACDFASSALCEADVKGKRVVEAGAYDYNGSVRGVYEAMGPESYTGTDMQPGPGVDQVCAAEDLPGMLGEATADVVISTEMLEHAEDWRGAVTGMVTVLAPGGLLLLTTRSPGFPYHPHPEDHWRYTLDHMDGIAEACGLEVLRLEPDIPQCPGVFLLARKPHGWMAAGMAEGLEVVKPRPAMASRAGWIG